ncbi:MAG: polymer-forming cytoskeletal protein [Chlamydiales bacterium]
MFRRPTKNPLDENALIYDQEPHTSSPYKYGSIKEEIPPRIFDKPHPQVGRASNRSLPNESQDEQQWNISEDTASLPHHFMKEEDPETTLGEGVTFRGELSFERLLRIDGSFEGELLSQGKVIIGPKGKVKANLNLREAVIEGEVEGNIVVQEKLELRGEALIKGDIKARSLCVDEGVQLIGHVNVTQDPAKEHPL